MTAGPIEAREVLASERAAKTHRAAARQHRSHIEVHDSQGNGRTDHQDQRPTVDQLQNQVLRLPIGYKLADLLQGRAVIGRITDVVSGSVVADSDSHNNLPALHGLVTRYVAGALLASRRWLQRRQWVRRAAVSSPRPSGTTGGDAA